MARIAFAPAAATILQLLTANFTPADFAWVKNTLRSRLCQVPGFSRKFVRVRVVEGPAAGGMARRVGLRSEAGLSL